MTTPEWVKVGAELIEVRSGWHGAVYGPTQKIAKVYKNGNFVVEGDDQQWRPWSDRAVKTGGLRSSATLHPITSELLVEKGEAEEMEIARRWVADEAERLSRLRGSDALDEYRKAKAEGRTAT